MFHCWFSILARFEVISFLFGLIKCVVRSYKNQIEQVTKIKKKEEKKTCRLTTIWILKRTQKKRELLLRTRCNEPKTDEERPSEASSEKIKKGKKNQIKISDCQFLLVQSGAGGHTNGDQHQQQQQPYSKRHYYRY